jgi:hypothetical protein
VPRLPGDRGNSPHERAADAENVNMHRSDNAQTRKFTGRSES